LIAPLRDAQGRDLLCDFSGPGLAEMGGISRQLSLRGLLYCAHSDVKLQRVDISVILRSIATKNPLRLSIASIRGESLQPVNRMER
jgi:hypothetical protein